jgi:outer membrane lipoprotein LolB
MNRVSVSAATHPATRPAMCAARPGLGLLAACLVLVGCATHRAAPLAPLPWEERAAMLQHASEWQLDGRTAVALNQQGWQASLDWRQHGDTGEVHLAGPLGVGAVALTLTPGGVSVNGAPPSEAQSEQLDERLGFSLPLAELRYWLLGVPAPEETFDLKRNADDRAAALTQAGWSIDYDRYSEVAGDWLPALLHLTRAGVRVKVAVDHWELKR